MKNKINYLSLLTVIMFTMLGVGFVSCGGNDDEVSNMQEVIEENNNTVDPSKDYTANSTVKTITLKNGYQQNYSPYLFSGDIQIYEDFNYKYSLLMKDGKIYLPIYCRENGSWRGYENSKNIGYVKNGQGWHLTGTKDVGKINDINDIEYKSTPANGSDTTDFGGALAIQPSNGFAMSFTTQDYLIYYLRVYIKEYTLDSNGSLETITIQYQLY